MSTASLVKSHLSSDSRYWKRGGMEYSGPSPLRDGSNSNGFHLTIESDEYGRWKDFVSGEKGSLYTLAKLLGISTPQRTAARDTSIPKTLKEYGASLGIPEDEAEEYLLSKRWEEGVHQNRPCIFVPNEDGWRQARYLDGHKPKWKPEFDLEKDEDGNAKLAFYGTVAAKRIAKEKQLKFLMLVNGASSVEALQYYGVPAFAIVGGENSIAKKVYADRIMKGWPHTVLIALDADKTGQDSTKKLVQLLGERGLAIDLAGLRDSGFDGADFAALWQEQSLSRLLMLADESETERAPRTALEASNAILQQIEGKRKVRGRFVRQPFSILHQFGGGALFFHPDLLTGVVGLSGHGKTSWWHSVVSMLMVDPQQFGFMIDSREFLPETDAARRLKGEMEDSFSYDDIVKHLVAMQEDEENIPHFARSGKHMAENTISKIKEVNAKFSGIWKGCIEYAEEYAFIEDTLDFMKRRTLEIREQGGKMDIWVFDYLTLYRCKPETLDGVGEQLYNVILQAIKDAARAVHVHAIVMLQPNKSPTAEALAKNKRLTVSDIGYINPNHMNTIIALNTLYGTQSVLESGFANHEGATWVVAGYDHATGLPLVDKALLRDGTNACIIEVLKNTFGRTGFTTIRGDFANLRWLDATWISSDLRLALDEGF